MELTENIAHELRNKVEDGISRWTIYSAGGTTGGGGGGLWPKWKFYYLFRSPRNFLRNRSQKE